jgi:hypothetical protein
MSNIHEFKFYSLIFPNEKTLVNFIFTNRTDNCFECFLTDYNKKAIMPFHLATLKSNLKNKNINTLAPLNKPLIGTVEEINDDTIIVSMAFIDKDSLEYKLFIDETSKNKIIASNVKKYTTKYNINYIDYWEKYIYPIDRNRMVTNEFNLFDYILNNMEDGHLDKSILDALQSINLKTTLPNIKFKLVSTNGIINIKKMINLALDMSNTKEILEVNIESAPNYYVTSTITTDYTEHNKFIQALESLSKNLENGIFISLI